MSTGMSTGVSTGMSTGMRKALRRRAFAGAETRDQRSSTFGPWHRLRVSKTNADVSSTSR